MEPEDGAEPESGAEQNEAARSRAARAAAALFLLAVAVFVAIVLLDLWVTRSSAQRSFIASNIACLRCHAEMVARLDDDSVHEPFAIKSCTSCHTAHGRRNTPTLKAGDFSAWRWLEITLDRIALGFVWRILSGSGFVAEKEAGIASAETTRAGPMSLRVAEDELCWTCHARLAPELFAQIVHEPFAEGRCTSCHDPHSSMEPTLLQGATEDLCVSCHRIGPDLLASEVHLPFGERACVSCHTPHSSEHPGMLVASQREVCFGCHGDIRMLVGESVQHEPFASGECTGCHRAHVADVAPLLTEAPPELCYGCHDDVRPEFSLASAHPVPGRLICGDCHMPHAAGFRGLLPVAQRTLCVGCHETVRDDLALPVVHEPVAEDACTSDCHRPHGSPVAPLLQAATPGLCYRCHPDKPPHTTPSKTVKAATSGGAWRYRHDLGPTVTEEEAQSLPPAAGGGDRPRGADPITLPNRGRIRLPAVSTHPLGVKVDCGSCHRAHASRHETLFVRSANALCTGCHASTATAFSSSSHAGVRCVRCHSVHDPEYAPLLTKGNPRLCQECHRGFDRANMHPAAPVYWDTLAREPLTCTSTCHNPHGSSNPRMLSVPYNTAGYGSDFICLLCHRQVAVQY